MPDADALGLSEEEARGLGHYAKAKKTLEMEGTIHDLIYDEEMGMEPFFKHFASWKPRAGHIVRIIGPEGRAGDDRRKALPLRFAVPASECNRSGQASRHLMRECRAGEHRNRAIRCRGFRGMVHQPPGARLDPFRTQDQVARMRRHGGQHAAHMLRWRHHQQRVESRHIGEVTGRPYRIGERGRGQEERIAVRGIDLLDKLLLARPDQYIASVAGEHLRQRRAPGTSS